MGHNFSCQANGNTVSPLSKQQGEFNRKSYGFPVPAVITALPFGGIGIKNYLIGEFG